jgi:hypothetical protein
MVPFGVGYSNHSGDSVKNLTKLVLTCLKRFLRFPSIIDVDQQTIPMGYSAVNSTERFSNRFDPSVFSVCPPDPVLIYIGSAITHASEPIAGY